MKPKADGPHSGVSNIREKLLGFFV